MSHPPRDPDTGRFTSGRSYDRRTAFYGTYVSAIPAADNAGGYTAGESNNRDTSQVLDMGEFLDADEVADLFGFSLSVAFSQPTTATAESSGQLTYAVSTDEVSRVALNDGSYLSINTTPPDVEEGILDIKNDQTQDQSVLHAGVLASEASHSDTVNNVGGGGINAHEHRFITAGEIGRMVSLDEEDSILIPHEIETRNVSDHDTMAQFAVVAHVGIRDT